MAHALGRGSTISGNMLAAIEKARSWNKHPSAWLVFGGKLFNGLVEAATPHGFCGARHWLDYMSVTVISRSAAAARVSATRRR